MIPEVQFEGVPDSVIFELIKQVRAEDLLAVAKVEREQAMINQAMGEHRSMDGLGTPWMTMSGTAAAYWTRRFGSTEWMHDSEFLNELYRDNDAMRVNAKGHTRIQTGYAPGFESSPIFSGRERNVRETLKYGNG